MSEDEPDDQSSPQEEILRHRQQLMDRMNAERRMGNISGAGPKGSRLVPYEELPDNIEALKRMYLELQRSLRDSHAQHHQEKERLRWGDEDTVEDLLSHIWKRGLELAGVIAALMFATTLLAPEQMTDQQQILGVIALTAFWERYLRSFFHAVGENLKNRL